MTQYLPTTPYRGTRDFLPPEMSVREQVFSRLYEVIERYGFVRYDGPILESAEIYEAKSGQEIANMQLYTLTDRGGRRLALRPEMTPSVARMIAANANSLQFPVRWYCNVNCHRYERPQRGRVREHWQINVDTFGSDSVSVETAGCKRAAKLWRQPRPSAPNASSTVSSPCRLLPVAEPPATICGTSDTASTTYGRQHDRRPPCPPKPSADP